MCPLSANWANLDAFYKLHGEERRSSRLFSTLQRGIFAIATNGEMTYVSAGWLHTTLTISGGSLLGTKWMFGLDRPMVAVIFARESRVDAAQTVWWPLLETFVTSINNGSPIRSSLQALCPIWGNFKTVSKKHKPSSFHSEERRKKIKRLEDTGGCGFPLETHEGFRDL